ncbi:cell division protein DivIVA [Corynebacterium liangguodongii]|uniref:Cell division protein DivIVA n=1 Tax=Corynebacterium liangguodongii TaxID=2079535 RepID=A0A2S0WDE5_9CORY|nr:cell division protein DivIVA [Corynebacterium liangguodongii]AWB83789.1 cell division protein DivIVA [Corynebacterium liangguodongii]PWB98910.1 cell division protein DivIVA [Corynebacterium liangguodongii]
MLSWVLIILGIAIVCLLGIMGSAELFGRGEAAPELAETTDVIEHNRRAVAAGDLGRIQLEVVHRGYRMDQVDALIAQLSGESGGVGAERRVELEPHACVDKE